MDGCRIVGLDDLLKIANMVHEWIELKERLETIETQQAAILSLLQSVNAKLDAALSGVLTPEQQALVDKALSMVQANDKSIQSAISTE